MPLLAGLVLAAHAIVGGAKSGMQAADLREAVGAVLQLVDRLAVIITGRVRDFPVPGGGRRGFPSVVANTSMLSRSGPSVCWAFSTAAFAACSASLEVAGGAEGFHSFLKNADKGSGRGVHGGMNVGSVGTIGDFLRLTSQNPPLGPSLSNRVLARGRQRAERIAQREVRRSRWSWEIPSRRASSRSKWRSARRPGSDGVRVIERPVQQVVERRFGVLRFDGGLERVGSSRRRKAWPCSCGAAPRATAGWPPRATRAARRVSLAGR